MKIETLYNLIQPLSHIGETESTTSFLNTITIVNNGEPKEVFALTGNSIRGTFRDCAARYLLNYLGIKIPKKEFNILFSGGNIAGSLTTDIDQAKKYRELLPVISIFGAGVGNQILNGKITQTFALPICKETAGIFSEEMYITEKLKTDLFNLSWQQQTGSINFTRFDDIKNTNLQVYCGENIKNDDKKRKKEEDSASTQMRYEIEYYIPGSQLYHSLILNTENIIEIGCFYSALKEFSKNPCLGGMSGKGFGMVNASFFTNGYKTIEIKDCELNFLLKEHEEALEMYNSFLETKSKEIIEFLNGVEI